MNGKSLYAFFVLLCMGMSLQVWAQDHPMITPYPGSTILNREVKDFDIFELPVGPATSGKPNETRKPEGKVTSIRYQTAKGRSTLEIMRNYESALTQAGFQILFNCSDSACGPQTQIMGFGYMPNIQSHYAAAKLARPEGDVYVGLHVEANATYLNVIETKPMEAGLVKITSEELASGISREGHIAVYGITFDTGKADFRAEALPVLEQIATLIKGNPALKLHVVGHTDNVGDFTMNMDLSKRRAESVVKELTVKYAVAGDRLKASGVGPVAPVATNKTEQGRAKNRRVELVEQ